jgi:hypothetical protein
VMLTVTLAVLAGCAANSGIVPTGSDTYFVSRQASTGLGGLANLKGEALEEAGRFCGAKGKTVNVVSEASTKPPYILGNYPRTEMQFKCV